MSSTKQSPDSRFDTTDSAAAGMASAVPMRIARSADRSVPMVVKIPERKSGPVAVPIAVTQLATPVAAPPTAVPAVGDTPVAETPVVETAVEAASIAPAPAAPAHVAASLAEAVLVATAPAGGTPADEAPVAPTPVTPPAFVSTPVTPQRPPRQFGSTPAIGVPKTLPAIASAVSLPALPIPAPPKALFARASSTSVPKSESRLRLPSTPLEAALEKALDARLVETDANELEMVDAQALVAAEGTPPGTPAVDAEPAAEIARASPASPASSAPSDAKAVAARETTHARDVGPTMKTRAIQRQRSSRKLLIAAIAMGGTALAVTAGVVVWAKSSVSQAERIAEISQVPSTPVVPAPVQAEPGAAHLTTTAEAAPALPAPAPAPVEPAPAPAPAPGPAPAPVPPKAVAHRAPVHHEKTTLTIWSEPAGADVVYNGVVLGKTPLTTTVDRDETATIWFHKKNFASDWRKVVTKEPSKTVSIKLKGMLLRPPI